MSCSDLLVHMDSLDKYDQFPKSSFLEVELSAAAKAELCPLSVAQIFPPGVLIKKGFHIVPLWDGIEIPSKQDTIGISAGEKEDPAQNPSIGLVEV